MTETTTNRVNDVLSDNGMEPLVPDPEPKKTKLSSEQGLAAHMLSEREMRQLTILEMNDLLKEVETQATTIVALRRELYQERLNNIAKENADLRRKYELPTGDVKYVIDDGDMYVLEGVQPPPQQ